MKTIKEFQKDRENLNDLVLDFGGMSIKRFYNLDNQVYQEGALTGATKELIGLVASLVLRCDDCVAYHILQCRDAGITDGQLEEALSIGLVVGGSITIPHLRRAVEKWNELKGEEGT